MVHAYEAFCTLNHSESEIMFFSIVFLYPHVVLHQQISTSSITEIFLRMLNLQYVNAKL